MINRHYITDKKIYTLIRLFSVCLYATLSLLHFCSLGQSPSKIELIHANTLEGDDSFGKDIRRLLGNVIFRQDSVYMYCDSAYLNGSSNSLDAYSNVRIQQGDTITLTGDMLKYDGNTKLAHVFNNITLKDKKMTLTTHNLLYNMDSGVSDYIEGGKIIDQENTLTSINGSYFSKEKKFAFHKNVVLLHPEYTMQTDTLVYYSLTKTSFFYGPCYIRSNDSSFIYCETGWYNTITEKSYFGKNAYLQNKEQQLKGDSILYDSKTKIGNAYYNVKVIDTTESIIVDGDYAFYDELKSKSFVTGKTMMTKAFEKDSLFMHADTLFATYDSVSKNKSYFAYHKVRLYKNDLQGVCDSLVYNSSDSLLNLYSNPVLWSDKNQLTADSISMQMANNKIDKMYLINNAFITSQEDTVRYNQVRGKTMTGFFDDNNLYRMDVFGNGQSIYYARNKKNQLTGVNRSECSSMIILFKNNKVSRIKLIEKPDATFYPINELAPSELVLKGFVWQQKRRPINKQDIFRSE